jgi:hypothetical protein
MTDDLDAETLIAALRKFADDLGETPTRTQMNDHGPYSQTPYYRVFGSWNDALRAAGFGTNHENDVSTEALVEALQDLNGELDRLPRFEDMEQRGAYSGHTYLRRFGSWSEAKEAAGLAGERQTSRAIEESELVRAMGELAEELGRAPTQTDMNELGTYSQRPYYRVWDSWTEALSAAGLDPDDRGSQGISDEALLDALRELSAELETTPTAVEMNEHGQYSVWPYLRRWGSWNDALRAAELQINKHHGVTDGRRLYEGNWLTQRRKALARDDWQCTECGMSEEEHVDRYGWGLEVHHRKKARQFDDLEAANRLANLQTVCRPCHREVERGTGTDE